MKHLLFKEEFCDTLSQKYIRLCIKYRYSYQILIKVEISLRGLEKYSNIKFHENRSGGSRVVPCRGTDRRSGMAKLVVALRNFANVPQKRGRLLPVV